MTAQEKAKLWLIINDNEAALFWIRAESRNCDYIECVLENCRDFGTDGELK